MSIQATNWYSVLGGEVSPNVQKRADMAKFGKWLDNAENIKSSSGTLFQKVLTFFFKVHS